MIRSIFQYDNIADGLIDFLMTVLAALISITFHECAHALMAFKLGDPTARNMGRLSLDPSRHIDLIGFLSFILLGMGWAKPVQVNINNFKNKRRDDMLVSLAGPLSNLIVGFVFFVCYFSSIVLGMESVVILDMLFVISATNISFALFNLIPIYPLDGYHIFTSLFPKLGFKSSYFMFKYGSWLLVILSYTGIISAILNPATMFIYDLFYRFCMLFV